MADLDGFSATRQLVRGRSDEEHSGDRRDGERLRRHAQAARDAGCVEYLPKPVRAEALFAALQKHLGVEFVWETEGEPSGDGRDRARRRIMPAWPRSCARRRRSARSPIFTRSPARSPCGDRAMPRSAGASARWRRASISTVVRDTGRVARGRARISGDAVLTASRRRRRRFSSSTTAPPTCRCWSARSSGTGHRILAAKDGPTALEIARRTQPDLMLLDVMMPGMDGFEVCRVLKAQPDTQQHARDLPVGARRGGGQGVGPRARRDRLHHQADPGRRSARARRRPLVAPASRARAAPEPRSPRQGAGRRGAHAAAAAAAGDAAAPVDQLRQLLPDQPSCRRRLLRRAAARRAIASASWWPTCRATARRRRS